MAEFKGLTIKFRGDTSELTKALGTINRESKMTQRELSQVNRILKTEEGAKSVEMLGQKVKLTSERAKQWQDRVTALESAQSELGERTADNADQYDQITARLERARVELTEYTRQMHEAEVAYDRMNSPLGKFGQGLQEAGGVLKTTGDGMQQLGGTLTRTVTAPLVALGTVSVKSAVDVDTALTGVRKTLDATDEEYERLKEAAIESSKVQPVDAATILNIEALGAQLGFSLDELEEFARVASGLDVATNMSWEGASTNMAQFANIMQMSHEDVGRYGSTIVDLGNHLATTESEVSDMGMRIAAAGKQLGLSEADVLGLAGALTSMGVSAEAGGTAISTIMSNIDKDVATNSENVGRWASITGQSAEEFAQSWKDKPVQALAEILSGMDSATEEGSSMAVMLDELGIGSIRQTDVMKRLAGNTQVMTDAIALANEAWENNTALQAEVDNRNESLASKFEILGNKVTAIAIEIGEPLAEALTSVVDAAEPIIQKISDMAKAFNDMDESQQRQIIKFAALAAAAGPALTIFGKLTSGFGGFITTLGNGAQGIAGFAGQLKRGSKLTEALTQSFTGGATALTGLKVALAGVGIAAAIALVAKLTEGWRNANAQMKKLGEVYSGMQANTEGLAASLRIGSTGLDEFGQSADSASANVGGLLDSIEQHNQRNAETRQQAETSVAMLGTYRDIINECAGAGEVSAEKQALLEWALKGLEEQTGKTWSAEDVLTGEYEDQEGVIHNTADAINDLISAKQQEARTNALQEMYTDAYKEQMKAEQELQKAEKAYHDHYDEWAKHYIESEMKRGKSAEEAAEAADRAFRAGEYGQLARDVDDATVALDGLKQETETYANLMTEAVEQQRAQWGEREGIIQTTSAMREACDAAGMTNDNIRDLAVAMENAGISTEEFAKVSGDQFAQIVAESGGDIDQIVAKLLELSSTDASVDVDTSELPKAKENVDKTAESQGKLKDSKTSASVTGNAADGKAATNIGNTASAEDKLHDVDVRMSANGNIANGSAANYAWSLVNAAAQMASKAITLTTTKVEKTVKNAAGGFVVPKHASGGFYDTATLTSAGIVGEDGREWYDGKRIIPITNHHYSDPLADSIAGRMAEKMSGPSMKPSINVTINGVSGPDETADAVVRTLRLYGYE